MVHHRPMVVETGLIGIFGLIGMTWIFPATGRLIAARRMRASAGGTTIIKSSRIQSPLIAVLVPAHNEEHTILETLRSVDAAFSEARASRPQLRSRVIVGADGCTDRTAKLAREFGAEVIETKSGNGKWTMLNLLAAAAEGADWVAFVDCGAVWENALLTKCLPLCDDPSVIGVAPAYRNPTAGIFEALSWAMESTLKRMEDQAGGPVSVHGATVLYRRKELMDALKHLSNRSWLNDDVVIPFTLRILNPTARIRYAHEARVRDSESAHRAGGAEPIREFGRRRRMVLGNIQWIRGILPEGIRKNPTVAYLALRRVFRLFWAWWGVVAVAPLLFVVARFAWQALPPGSHSALIAACGIALVLFTAAAYRMRRPLIGLLDAAMASLLAPFFFFGGPQARWK